MFRLLKSKVISPLWGLCQNILEFFTIYSISGWIVFWLVFSSWANLLDLIVKIDKFFEMSKAGVYDMGSFKANYNTVFIFINIVTTCYLAFFTLITLLTRFFINKSLKNFSLHHDAQQVILKFHQPLRLNFLILKAKLVLINLTTNKKVVWFENPDGILIDNQLVFKTNRLPSGNYKIDKIFFYYQDPLLLIKAKKTHKFKDQTCTVYNRQQEDDKNVKLNNSTRLKKLISVPLLADQDFFSSRPYQSGDDLKRIHWKKVAQLNQLVIRKAENKEVKETDLNIIINLYVPYLTKVNQTRMIGNFINSFTNNLKKICQHNYRCKVYINSAVPTKELIIDQKNMDKSIIKLFPFLIAQDKKTLISFLKTEKINQGIIFSLSSDPTALDKTVLNNFHSYIYKLGLDPYLSTLSFVKAAYKNPEHYGLNFLNSFRQPFSIKQLLFKGAFKALIKRNEKAF